MRFALGVVVLVLAACSEAPTSVCIPEVDPSCEAPPEPGDEVIGGVNLTALFAQPTPAEADSARLDIPDTPTATSRTLTPLSPADGARRFALALEDSLGRRVVTALVRVPGDASETSPLPVVVVLPEADDAGPADLLTEPDWGALVTSTVQVALAYRGGTLDLEDASFPSALPADPYRADVQDVLALVGALEGVPRADDGRRALLGVGRGGTVALLAAPALEAQAVVTLGAPTDLFAPSFVADVRERLLGRDVATPFPAFDALFQPVLETRTGGDLEAARRSLLALSPSRLGLSLPPVLALHAAGDETVGQDQLESLRQALAQGGGQGVLEVVEGATHDSLVTLPRVRSSIASFLSGVL